MTEVGKTNNMAQNLWYEKINRNVDWGGDESTNNLPVAGSVVQDFIKSELNDKIGIIYHDQISSRYLCFANEDDKNIYINDPTKTELIKSELPAPANNIAEVNMLTPNYNALLLGTTGNYLEFGFDIKNAAGQSQVDNVDYKVTITRNANISSINGTCVYNKTTKINLDDYLIQEGTFTIVITIKGQTTYAEGSTVVTYDVINLSLSNDFDVSTIHDKETGNPVIINYTIFGSSVLKYVEWYIDSIYYSTDTLTGGTVEPLAVTKYFGIQDLTSGIHNIQFRAYVDVNGEKFYTDTVYREFIVVSDTIEDVVISLEAIIPTEFGIITEPKIYNAVQYEPYTFYFGVYNKGNLEHVPISIYIDEKLTQVINASNETEMSYTLVSEKSGVRTIKMVCGDYVKSFDVVVLNTDMNIHEITDNLILSLSAIGRSNSDANKDEWNFGEYSTQFNGFTWSETSGWNNNRLIIGEGMSINTNIKPFYDNTYGKSIEIEFETINVIDDNAVICDIRNSNGVGLLLTASEASLRVGTSSDQIISTKFKSEENIRICFVINNETKMVLIYINGIVSGAIKYSSSFSVDNYIKFSGSSDAGVKLKQILIYNTKLNSDQILNNYILYRDSIDEMRKLYDRNDILDGSLFSIEKISQHIPVMMITGDVAWLETQKDTDAQTGVDVEYINNSDPTRNFKMEGGCLRIQGTSSAGYPKKNFRLYTKRKTYSAKVYDYQGKLVENQKLSFKEGAAPVKCWCLKADYAESSGTHNTGVATMWNDVMYSVNDSTEGYVCRTNAQKAALDNNYTYDVRTTVDGFPIVVFARQTKNDEYIFIGKYNFNNDKSTENVFGFCDIPGFDDSKVQCWEMTENGNNYALFQTTEGWFDQSMDSEGKPKFDDDDIPIRNWASGFEARYPDDGNEADTTDLKAFADWLIGCDAEKFALEKSEHIDLWKTAAYYVYLMRFGAVDQVVKNSMFTTEDGKHWYYINYDNDTVLGLKNTGALTYPPTITRETKDGNTYAYAGHESRLWNMLENDSEFMRYVSRVDSLLYNAGLTYNQAIKYFNGNQSDKWCERIYNQDAEYKYITPSTTISDSGLEVNTLFMMQGSRKAHRTWWLAKRFKLMDGKFNNSNYVNQNIMIKLNGSPGLNIGITAGEYMYYGCESNSVAIQMGVELNAGESYNFYKAPATEPNGKDFAVGDPIYIYAPYAIEVLDLSKVSQYLEEITLTVKDPILGTRLKKLIMSSLENPSQNVNFVAGLSNAINLEYLDVRGLQIGSLDFSELRLLRTLLTKGSGLTSIKLPDGCAIETLQIGNRVTELVLSNLSNLTMDNIEGFTMHHVNTISITGCPNLTNDFSMYHKWVQNVQSEDSLTLVGIEWNDIAPETLIEFGKVQDVGGTLSLKGKISISAPTLEQVYKLQSIFGDNCFTNNGELWISAPDSIFIQGPSEIRSDTAYNYSPIIFSKNPGTVEWTVVTGSEFVEKLDNHADNTATLYPKEFTNEDKTIIIKAVHTPANSVDSYVVPVSYEIISKKINYANSGTIRGNARVEKNETFTLDLGSDPYLGRYTTEWSISGNSFDNGSIALINPTNNSITIEYLQSVIFDKCSLIAHVINSDGSTFDVILPITVTDETVLLTNTSNPEVLEICYSKGLCKSDEVMYKAEARSITDEDFGQLFAGSSIKSFDEFEYFTGLKTIVGSAFYACRQLKSIVIPNNIQSIGSLAFGYTSITSINIPTSVTRISYNAFIQASSLKEIIVSGGNTSYRTIDSALVDMNGTLIKFPEGIELDSYTVNPSIIGLGQQSLFNTKLKELNTNNVVSHASEAISSNKYLETLYIGPTFSDTNFASNIGGNEKLQNIFVSNEHPSLCDQDGIVYDKSQTVLIKYPENKIGFNILPVESIGTYSFWSCSSLGDIKMPVSVKYIRSNAFYFAKAESISFEDGSLLENLDSYCFAHMNVLRYISLPPSLKTIGANVFQGDSNVQSIYFEGEAPTLSDVKEIDGIRNITTAFGTIEYLMGKNVDNKIMYVPASSTGYEHQDWQNSILSVDRNNYTLSKTL